MKFDLIEYVVQTYPPGLEGWSLYRVEYGGHAENCIFETHLWLPPNLDVRKWENYMKAEMGDRNRDEDEELFEDIAYGVGGG